MDPVSYVSCVSCVYWMYAAEPHETIHWESGMRYQLQTTTSCRLPLTATLHVVVLTEPHDNEPVCGTTPAIEWCATADGRSHRYRGLLAQFRMGRLPAQAAVWPVEDVEVRAPPEPFLDQR